MVALMAVSFVIPLASTQTAYAIDGSWVDAATINIGGDNYIDVEVGDSMDYYLNGETECSSYINGFSDDFWDGGAGDTTARFNPRSRNPATGSCQNGAAETANLSNPENAGIYAHWVDQGTLRFVEGVIFPVIGNPLAGAMASAPLSGAILTRVEGRDNVFSPTEGECRSTISITNPGSGTTPGEGTLFLRYGDNCSEDEGFPVPIRIGSPENAGLPAGTGERPVGDVADGEDDSCETNSGVLGWIMCPLSGLLDGAVSWLDDTIQGQLLVERERYTNPGLFTAWKQVRNISYVILIPIMLIMVIGTALGFEVFSAYTIKRALPRMVIAVIFITLSWYICAFLIGFFNVLGTGILGIITSPFDETRTGLRGALELAGIVETGGSGLEDATSGLGLVGLIGVAGGAAILSGAVTLGIIMSTLFSAALVLLVVFFILVARQMFLLLLILAAPLAILAWIFPGNDKMWKLWWGSFWKLLMMFPLIMAIIGLGRVFASVIGSAAAVDNGNQIVTMLIIVAAYIIPYAAIPFTFKWVGGLFGNLAGMVNDRNRGLLDRSKKKRADIRERTRENAGNNRRFNPNGRLGKLNNMASWAADPVSNVKVGLGTTGGKQIMGEINQKQLEQTSKVAQLFSQAGLNDRAGKAIAGFESSTIQENIAAARARGETVEGMRAVRNINDLNHNAAIMRQFGDDNDKLGAEQISSAAVQGIVAGAWNNPDLQKADIQAAGYMSSASQGFAERDEIMTIANRAKQTNGGDTGFSSQMASQLSLAAYKGGRLDMKPGYGVLYDETAQTEVEVNGKKQTIVGSYRDGLETVDKQVELVKTLKQSDFMQAKPKSVKSLREGIKAIASSTATDQDSVFLKQAMEQNVLLGASTFSSTDPGSKAEWKKIAKELGLTDKLDAMDAAAAERRARSAGAGGGGSAAADAGDSE